MLGLSLSSLKLNEFMPCVWHCLHILGQVVLEMHNDTNHSPDTMPSIVPALLHSASFSPWKKAVSLALLSPLKLFQDTITSQRNQPFLPFEFSPYSRPPNSESNTPADKKSIIAWHRSSPKKNRAKQEFPGCKKKACLVGLDGMASKPIRKYKDLCDFQNFGATYRKPNLLVECNCDLKEKEANDMCFLKELGKLDCAFQAILNRNLMKHVKIYKSASVKWLRLNQKSFSVPNGYLEGIWLIWPTGVSVLHVSLFGSPRLKKYMRQFNLKTFNFFESNDHYSGSVAYASNWILYGKNLRDQNPWRLDLTLKLHLNRLWTGHSKPSQPNPGSTLKFYRNNSNPVDVMIPFDCDDRCFFFFSAAVGGV